MPTLVIHNRDDAFVRVGHGRYLAEHIRDARLLERDSADHWLLPEPDLVGAIEEFVTGSRSGATTLIEFSRRCSSSTSSARPSRSAIWATGAGSSSSTASGRPLESMLALHAGELVDTAGDGFLATFDGPARAIRCAWHIRDELRRQGLEVRAGLHVGEVSRRPGSVAGITVHIGARVSALAAPGEVLVTRTVRDLVAGSGIAFEQRGEHELKGVPDSWALYAAVG